MHKNLTCLYFVKLFDNSDDIFENMDHIRDNPMVLPSYSEAERLLKAQHLPYLLGKNTLENNNTYQTNSFFLALVDQLSDSEIRLTISKRARQFYKTSSDEQKMANEFRNALVEYCRKEFTSNSSWGEMERYKIRDVMEHFDLIESEWSEDGKSKIFTCLAANCKKKFNGVDSIASHVVSCYKALEMDKKWETLLRAMKFFKKAATEVFVRAAALFFEKDILIIEEGTNYRIYGTLNGVSKNPPMAMVHMARGKFQSARRMIKSGSSSERRLATKAEDSPLCQIEKCRGCKSKVQQINKHLVKKPECKKFYTKDELIADSKKKRCISKKSYYEANRAEIKKQNQADNTHADFICHLCNEKKFSSQEHLARHIETVHVKSDKHICAICQTNFSREDALARHVINTHEAKKILKCPECPLTFARRDTLNKHVSRATDHPEKHGISVHCKYCEKDVIFSSLAAYNSACKKGEQCDCQSKDNP